MHTTTPVHHLDASPEGHAVSSGSADDPTDAARHIEAPADGWLTALIVSVDGELGLQLSRKAGGRLVPAERGIENGYLFRSSWPDAFPVGRTVHEAEKLVVIWRNRGGAEVAVDAAASFAPRGRRGDQEVTVS